jgi:RNA polymerase sigma-70 factor, ECF subfamily
VRAEVCTAHRPEGSEKRLRLLMIRGLEGDSRAYRQLLGELARCLRGYFNHRIRALEVEDLVQETLLAVHSKRHTYDRALPFRPWAYAVARYKLADHFRRNRSSHVALEDAADPFAPEDSAEAAVRTDLGRLLEHLPARRRRPMLLRRRSGARH